jgi:methionyl aminopeptidase
LTVQTPADIDGLKKAGALVAHILRELTPMVASGVRTWEIDERAGHLLESAGAKSAPKLCYEFPGNVCISINDEAAHGVPGDRVIARGDLVHLDISAELGGYFADTGATIAVPPLHPRLDILCRATRRALDAGLKAARAGALIRDIERAFAAEAAKDGLALIRNLTGHGLGRHLHEEPRYVPDYSNRNDERKITEGLVLAIEPYVSTGPEYASEDRNGWVLKIPRGQYVAQYEHTIIVTRDEPIVITRP